LEEVAANGGGFGGSGGSGVGGGWLPFSLGKNECCQTSFYSIK